MSDEVKEYIIELFEKNYPIFLILEKLNNDFGLRVKRWEVEAVINHRYKNAKKRKLEELDLTIDKRKQLILDALKNDCDLEKLNFVEKNYTGIERAIAIYLKNLDEKDRDNALNLIIKKISE